MRNRQKVTMSVTRLHQVRNSFIEQCAFTIGCQKTFKNVLYHNLKEFCVGVCLLKFINDITPREFLPVYFNELVTKLLFSK